MQNVEIEVVWGG